MKNGKEKQVTNIPDLSESINKDGKRVKRIPIKALKDLAKKYSITHAVLLAYDGEKDHVVTYGKTVDDCSRVADAGNRLKKHLKWPDSLQSQPLRVKKLQQENEKLKKELKESIPVFELEGLMKELWKDYCKLSDARNEGNVGIRMAIRKIRRLLNRQNLIDKGRGKDE